MSLLSSPSPSPPPSPQRRATATELPGLIPARRSAHSRLSRTAHRTSRKSLRHASRPRRALSREQASVSATATSQSPSGRVCSSPARTIRTSLTQRARSLQALRIRWVPRVLFLSGLPVCSSLVSSSCDVPS
ncbi:hypothetical protein EXIGLDRAFT_754096 [Exidia glandulosa HHB12029]|uniref:Uncharacterized protein n=1 Tax=Exidia glandulosa HHB12029 TaxID=1314781 RepID=A0A165D8K5_EXIGL|nr:hypothetical protein EXIGLDRAFT_754096 [Exidia glandulosa HHB12029]